MVEAGRRPGPARPAGPRRRIGLAWPRDGRAHRPGGRQPVDRRVRRAVRSARGHVEIAYYADDFVVLHEAAHAWFNGALLADRWANEAFASYYGPRPAKELKVKATPTP